MIPDQTDVLVVGGGNAAMCAAMSASEAGANVVVLEAATLDMRGGNTRHTRNLRAAHDAPVFNLEGSYTEREFWQDIRRVTAGNTDEKLTRLMIQGSASLLSWLYERGVRFQPALRGTLSLARTNAFFLGGGKTLLNAEYRAAEQLGVRCFYETEVTDLSFNGAGFSEATYILNNEECRIRAGAVVIASGGFQANDEWMREAWGPAADNFIIRGTGNNRGAMLANLMEQGADTVGDLTQCHAIAVDGRAPKYDGGIVSRLDCVPFGIVVNRDGQRFYDEGEDFWPKRYAIWGRLVAAQPTQTAWAIIDSKVVDAFMPSVFSPLVADSIPELASQIGVPTETLESTIKVFNAAVVPGDFDAQRLDGCGTRGLEPPKSNWAQEINVAPYLAWPLRPGITFTYLALKVDENSRVSFSANKSVRNVFAAGEVMAGNILGQGYCAGTGMTIGGVFGRIAGEQAAREALHR